MGQRRVKCFTRSRNGMLTPEECIPSCWPTLELTGLHWRIQNSPKISQFYGKAYCGMYSHSVHPPPGRVPNHRELLCRCSYQPSRDGFLQVFRDPAILSVPVSTADPPDRVLDLIEQGWADLRLPGTVVPWQLFPIDSTRAQSSHRALAYPTYIMVSHEDFASFEQRPHGLMEIVVPGNSWLLGTVLPWRVNWSILREFVTPFCPLGMVVDRLELHLSGAPLTEQLVDCWHGFYARVILTLHGAPAAFSQPFGQLWAPFPHLSHEPAVMGVSQHAVFVQGSTSLLFCYMFQARGSAERWFDWLPNAVQASALLVRPVAFRLRPQRVHEAIRTEMPVCRIGTAYFALVPALTPAYSPLVIVVKISFPPMVKVGAIFCPDRLSRLGLLRQLGLDGMCLLGDEEPCTC